MICALAILVGASVMTVLPMVPTPPSAFASGEPWSIELEVVELPPNLLFRQQRFTVTMTGGPDLCTDLAEDPWWSGTECWYPDGWGGNFGVTRLPDGRTAQMRLLEDCWRDDRKEWASVSCTVVVGLPGFGYPSGPNPLFFTSSGRYRGTDYSPSTGGAKQIPINWNVLYPGSEPVNDPPLAGFSYTFADDDPLTVDFTNSSTDPQDPLDQLSSRWEFGDGAVSADPNPSHTYVTAGDYEVALTVTDRGGSTNTSRRTIEVRGSNALVVNSTGDRSAIAPAVRGCDTGELVGDDIECTLRAAIEAANALGGGEITFAIVGAGVPEIRLASALPAVAAPTVIDATTQTGGLVEVSGGGTTGIELAAGPSTLTGLAITGSEESVRVTGGDGHRIVGNRLGVDAAGEPDGTLYGAIVGAGSGTTVTDNEIASDVGVGVGPDATSVEVSANTIGYEADGTTQLGNPTGGVLAYGAGMVVRNNVVRGTTVGIHVLGVAAVGTVVDSNRVGVDRTGSAAAEGSGYGIRIDGTPDVSITANRVVSHALASIAVAGSAQAEIDADGSLQLLPPDEENTDQPVTGGRARIADNVVGLTGNPGSPAGTASSGILLWAGASDATIEDNTIGGAGAGFVGLSITGGANHRVTGNDVGSVGAAVADGIAIVDSPTATVGAPGDDGNVVITTRTSIELNGNSVQARIENNRITGIGTQNVAVEVDEAASGATVIGNVVIGGALGIVIDAASSTIAGNTVSDLSGSGIVSGGDGARIMTNSVFEVGGVGAVVAGGDSVEVSENRVGLGAGDAVDGNDGVGIVASSGTVSLSRNVVAGSDADGVRIAAGAVANVARQPHLREWVGRDLHGKRARRTEVGGSDQQWHDLRAANDVDHHRSSRSRRGNHRGLRQRFVYRRRGEVPVGDHESEASRRHRPGDPDHRQRRSRPLHRHLHRCAGPHERAVQL